MVSIFSLIGSVDVVDRLEAALPSSRTASTSCATASPPSPPLAQTSLSAARAPQPLARLEHRVDLLLGVGGEAVERHDHGHAELLHVLRRGPRGSTMPRLSAATSGVPRCVLLDAAVHLERAHRRDDDRGLRLEPAEPALDVEELLGAEVGAEARLGQHDVAEGEAQLGRDERVAAVRDVAERARRAPGPGRPRASAPGWAGSRP